MRFPDKKYNIIYADPPWSYRDKCKSGERGASFKYDLMNDEDIYRLPVNEISSDDCVLFMWATMPKLQEALNTIQAWGFTYKTCAFTWVKKNKKSDSWFWGMGAACTRSNAELCLFAKKGKLKRLSGGVHSVLDDRIMRHSQKPSIVREHIVTLFGDLPRIELFARETAKGWDSWGNEL